MARSSLQLREDLLAIWGAGVESVHSQRLVERHVSVTEERLRFTNIHGTEIGSLPLVTIGKLCVVGGGKAAAGMAVGIERVLGREWLSRISTSGWVNIPAGSEMPTEYIHLHAARPAGQNEPSVEAQQGGEIILEQVSRLGPRDVCLVLLSGGGSALLPVPRSPVTLADKLAVTRYLSAAGASIHELNTVRKQLSRIKGGGLARACRAGHLITLVISDVLGDPLDIIASGPTIDDSSTAEDARRILLRLAHSPSDIPATVWETLAHSPPATLPSSNAVTTTRWQSVIGNIDVALRACRAEAESRGYRTHVATIDPTEPTAEEVADRLVTTALELADTNVATCLISGGEPTVKLSPATTRGQGGRNQQLVLAAMHTCLQASSQFRHSDLIRRMALLSGGTDGEDGPTDAAGAHLWPDLLLALAATQIDPGDYLARNDAYHFLGPLGCLVRTGPTHTNVCDIRVLLVDGEDTLHGSTPDCGAEKDDKTRAHPV